MNYFGYATEQWAAVVARARPVYAVSVLESGGARNEPTLRRQVIQLAQLDERGDIQYCRLHLGAITYLYGKPFEAEATYRAKQARQ